MITLLSIGISEFCVRLVARAGSGDWLLLTTSSGNVELISQRIEREFLIYNVPPRTRIHHPADAHDLIDKISSAAPGILILSGLDHFSQKDWQDVDLSRSRLTRDQPVILVISGDTLASIVNFAPNLASWIGGSSWQLNVHAEELSAEEREARLDALRRWAGLTDDEVIKQAEQKHLPNAPEFAEWLVLLNRGDLL